MIGDFGPTASSRSCRTRWDTQDRARLFAILLAPFILCLTVLELNGTSVEPFPKGVLLVCLSTPF